MIRACYLSNQERFTADFSELEEKRCTHIISNFSGILSSYSPPLPWTSEVRIQEFIDAIRTTDLKMVVTALPFRDGNGFDYDPENKSYTDAFIDNIGLLSSLVDISGFIFDDFVYPTSYVDNNRLDEQQQVLIDIMDNTKDKIYENSSNTFFAVSTGYQDYPATEISEIAHHADILFPQIYRLNRENKAWFKQKLNNYIEKASNSSIVPYISTYYNPSNLREMGDLYSDINIILSKHLDGYSLFYNSMCGGDVFFPSKIRIPVTTK